MHSRLLMFAGGTAVVLATSGSWLPIAAQQAAVGKPDMLAVQVMLDRARFSPGEIDGKGGPNTQPAIDNWDVTAVAALIGRGAMVTFAK